MWVRLYAANLSWSFFLPWLVVSRRRNLYYLCVKVVLFWYRYLILIICKLGMFPCCREIRLFLPFRTCILHLQASSRSWHRTSRRFQLRFDRLEFLCHMSSAPEKLQNIHLKSLALSFFLVVDYWSSFYLFNCYLLFQCRDWCLCAFKICGHCQHSLQSVNWENP